MRKLYEGYVRFYRISGGDIHKRRRLLGLFGVLKTTSPLPKTGCLPHVSFHLLFGGPPPSPSEETSFMDGPLVQSAVTYSGSKWDGGWYV